MKVNELMIGDWVRQWHRYGSGLHDYCEDIKIDGCRMNTVGWEYEGIPLTEEILKLNGFAETEFSYNYDDFRLYFYKDGFAICFRDNIIQISYVHELQHALRLCGLCKLANNFKIK